MYMLLSLDVALILSTSVQRVVIFGRENWLVEEGQGPKKQPKSQKYVALIHHPKRKGLGLSRLSSVFIQFIYNRRTRLQS